MKRILISFLILGSLALGSFEVLADLPPLRTQETIRMSRGKTRFSGVLADPNGEIYIEVPQGMNGKIGGQAFFNFDGFLLAPNLINLPIEFPLRRSREIISFEFLADNAEPVHFSDKYFAVPLKRRLFTENEKAKAITAYVPIGFEENVRDPELWYYDEMLTEDTFDDKWMPVGGILEDTSDPDIQLFTAVITKTGLYTLVDRRPLPTFTENTDPGVIQAVENSPFPSVDPSSDRDAPVELQEGEGPDIDPFGEGTQFIGGSEGAIPTPITIGGDQGTGEDEIPAVSPLVEQGLVPTSQGDQGAGLDNELDEIPSLEQQQGNLDGSDLQTSLLDNNDEALPLEKGDTGGLLPTEETGPESDFLEPLTEEDILAQLENPESQSDLNPSDLQANSFDTEPGANDEVPGDGEQLPRTGTQKEITLLLLSVLVIGGSVYYYRKEKREMKEEVR